MGSFCEQRKEVRGKPHARVIMEVEFSIKALLRLCVLLDRWRTRKYRSVEHALPSFRGHNPRRKKQYVDLLFLFLDLIARFVDAPEQTRIRLNEVNRTIRIELGQLIDDPGCFRFIATHKIYARLDRVPHEFPGGGLSYPRRSTNCRSTAC